MKLKDLYRMAKENLFRRKLRTSLTILSIVIGTVSIILMMALGEGVQSMVRKEFSSFGSVNVLEVSKKEEDKKKSRFYESKLIVGLTDQDVISLGQIPGVEVVAPLLSTNVTIYTTKYYNTMVMVGMDPYLMKQLDFATTEGRLPEDNHYLEVVFGDKALEGFKKIPSTNPNAEIQRPEEEIKGTEEENKESEEGIEISFGSDIPDIEYAFEPMEERYKMQLNLGIVEKAQKDQKLYTLYGVGILKEGDLLKDYNVYVPMEALNQLIRSYKESNGLDYQKSYTQIMVKVKDLDQIKVVAKKIENMGYSVFSMLSILDSITNTISGIKLALGAIGGIALFVAAIGITNTMVMAITERKKEIGIMKVIGATIIDIKRLFLLEAAMIGLVGGCIGILICISITKFISSEYFNHVVLKKNAGSYLNFSIPTSFILGGIVFTTFVGIASGYLPARKAMRSSALEAIRND